MAKIITSVDMTFDHDEFSKLVNEAIAEFGLQFVCQWTGYSENTLQGMANDRQSWHAYPPSMTRFLAICNAMHRNPADFFILAIPPDGKG